MKILVTEQAESSLNEALLFLVATGASITLAERIAERIYRRILQLKKFPRSGSVETYLSELGQNHRYLVEGNYKIIYFISGKTVYVTDVFDVRQDPARMKG
ncbi:MAG: plasmid stabilization system [Bacteroidetes bacterium]|nr:MAG: plasmid stabilization system [Bacteroidota bacterium]